MPLPFLGQQPLAAVECIGEDLSIFSMHQAYSLRLASFDETNQVIVAGVRAEVELLPLALDVDRGAVQVDHAFLDKPPTVRPLDLVACQEDRAPRIFPDHL